MSIYLSKQGAIVSVFDKREDIRLDTNTAGRSINLALSNRGINALNEFIDHNDKSHNTGHSHSIIFEYGIHDPV